MPPENKEAAIILDKELRRDIDAIIQRLDRGSDETDYRISGERNQSRLKLVEAVMWLGMDLKDLGTPNPYPNSKDPSNTTVDPTADGLKL